MPGRYTLTVRHRSRVERERFEDLAGALDALEQRAAEIQAEGPLPSVKAFRDIEPGERVAGRLEISARRGRLRRREAGIDVKGNGELVPYAGAVSKRPLDARRGETAFDALRRTLSGG